MRILLVRHGQSEGNVDENKYIEVGDHDIALTHLGWRQAIGTGRFLADLYKGKEKWPTTYISSYRRPKETMSGILHGMGDVIPGEPYLREDPRLIEQYFGAGYYFRHAAQNGGSEWAKEFARIADDVNKKDRFAATYPLGESPKQQFIAVRSFIDGTLARQVAKGDDDFLIVCHGAVINKFLFIWAHLPLDRHRDLVLTGNAGVISIEGEFNNWRIRKIYDGEAGKPVDIDVLNGIRYFSVSDLPPVPNHIKENPELDVPDIS
ncbi:MAG: hypothetical protein GC137_04600 [Alphaproteobacteria bacterium]|nr:hypothetical protein [Alphaproteobacteria bacterium]